MIPLLQQYTRCLRPTMARGGPQRSSRAVHSGAQLPLRAKRTRAIVAAANRLHNNQTVETRSNLQSLTYQAPDRKFYEALRPNQRTTYIMKVSSKGFRKIDESRAEKRLAIQIIHKEARRVVHAIDFAQDNVLLEAAVYPEVYTIEVTELDKKKQSFQRAWMFALDTNSKEQATMARNMWEHLYSSLAVSFHVLLVSHLCCHLILPKPITCSFLDLSFNPSQTCHLILSKLVTCSFPELSLHPSQSCHFILSFRSI